MEFLQGRGGYCEDEEEDMNGNMGNKFPFNSSSSSSSSYPSSSQYKAMVPHPNQRWGSQIYDEEAMRSYDRDAVHFGVGMAVTNLNQKPELMDLSSRYIDNNGQVESDCGGGSGGGDVVCIEKEHMFDKIVTPSDVGKLNRLVIPKQHAEKYFPLDSSANEKGLLLNFEDRSGKPWRFRYSYWNSSQSYVMTKGWSRFVKEKKLYAGDIVSFERGAGESGKDHLYIDWRHQPPDRSAMPTLPLPFPRSVPWGGLFVPPTMSVSMSSQMNYDQHHHQRQQHGYHHHHHDQYRTSYDGTAYGYNVVNPGSGSIYYLRSSGPHQVGAVQQVGDHVPMVYDSMPVVHGKAAAKRLRLFGVNLECPISSEDPNCDVLSSTAIQHTTMPSHSPQLPPSHLPLQLRLYNGASIPTVPIDPPNKGKQSLSLDLDI